MDKFNRSVRIHHTNRIKVARKSYWSWDKKPPRVLGMLVHTAALCSCHMCGNPRKYRNELTMQELTHLDIIKSYLE